MCKLIVYKRREVTAPLSFFKKRFNAVASLKLLFPTVFKSTDEDLHQSWTM